MFESRYLANIGVYYNICHESDWVPLAPPPPKCVFIYLIKLLQVIANIPFMSFGSCRKLPKYVFNKYYIYIYAYKIIEWSYVFGFPLQVVDKGHNKV